MKKNTIILLVLIISISITRQGFGAPVKAFILAGQSNMVGIGNIMDLPPELKTPQPDVMIYTAGTLEYDWISLEPGVGASTGSFGSEVTFGRDISTAFPGEPIALIKIAWSGTSLAYDWRPPSAGAPLGRLYTEFVTNVNTALSSYPGGKELEIMGMCWMQGESDASNIYPASDYETNLTCFINDIRNEFNLPSMPFIIAMIDQTDVWEESAVVRAAQVAVSRSLENIGIFDTDDYPTDGSHYYSEGLIMMGEDYASTMLEVLSIVPELGDVNNDGRITIADALLVARHYVGLQPANFDQTRADVDNNGRITINDALLIARYYVGLITEF